MMTPAASKPQRILAIDPSPRGFGFVVMERPERCVNWGLKETRGKSDGPDERRDNRNAHCLRQIAGIVERYKPDLIAVEDIAHGSRRGERARDLILRVHDLGFEQNLPTRAVSKHELGRAFGLSGAATKEAVARMLAEKFPELALRLPPPRKPWSGSDPRMSIFGAAGMAAALLRGE